MNVEQDVVRQLLEILGRHRGFANRIKSVDLQRLVGENRRTMRKAIEIARCTDPVGALSCRTTRRGGGYFLATSQVELEEYLRQDEHRCKEMWRRLRTQRRVAQGALQRSPVAQMGIWE